MLGRIGIGAGEQKDIVGDMRAGGEHLLPGDDPVVPIAHGAGAGGVHV